MTRLFTALWPTRAAVAALDRELSEHPDWPPDGWRATPTVRWHVTLGFHGEAEPGVLARRLEARAGGLAAPWLRMAGTVSFPKVAAVAVLPAGAADADALAELVVAAGGDPASFRGHLTVARTSRRNDAPPSAGPLGRHRGPWWRPLEVCLVRSELRPAGPRYTVLHRVPLRARPGSVPPAGPVSVPVSEPVSDPPAGDAAPESAQARRYTPRQRPRLAHARPASLRE
jgi:RNA 2',3'-cyclic 3'-phosphodiesterase